MFFKNKNKVETKPELPSVANLEVNLIENPTETKINKPVSEMTDEEIIKIIGIDYVTGRVAKQLIQPDSDPKLVKQYLNKLIIRKYELVDIDEKIEDKINDWKKVNQRTKNTKTKTKKAKSVKK